jgi:signal transduction histidine kinase
MTPMVVEFDLYAFIEETINGMIPPRGVDIRVLRDPDVSSVRSDPMMLRRVVTNLLNNAFQAMPNGGVLTLRVRRDGMYWGVDIVDTGVGIPPESINSIFTPLFTTKPKGIGLGLSVVKRLIEALGGRVEFRSTVGVETTFTFWLPE